METLAASENDGYTCTAASKYHCRLLLFKETVSCKGRSKCQALRRTLDRKPEMGVMKAVSLMRVIHALIGRKAALQRTFIHCPLTS